MNHALNEVSRLMHEGEPVMVRNVIPWLEAVESEEMQGVGAGPTARRRYRAASDFVQHHGDLQVRVASIPEQEKKKPPAGGMCLPVSSLRACAPRMMCSIHALHGVARLLHRIVPYRSLHRHVCPSSMLMASLFVVITTGNRPVRRKIRRGV